MNIFNTITQLVVTDKPQSRRIDASQLFPVTNPSTSPFRLRAYTERPYGASVGRTLYGRYTR
jgi:hypothetical protein